MKSGISREAVIGLIVAIVAVGGIAWVLAGRDSGVPDTERLRPDEAAGQMQAPEGAGESPAERWATESQMGGTVGD